MTPNYFGEVAERYRYRDGGGEIGMIASVTQPFCGDCTRARLTADGKLFTCLFATRGHDLRGPLRAGATDDEIAALLGAAVAAATDRYSERRSAETVGLRKVEMSASAVEPAGPVTSHGPYPTARGARGRVARRGLAVLHLVRVHRSSTRHAQ